MGYTYTNEPGDTTVGTEKTLQQILGKVEASRGLLQAIVRGQMAQFDSFKQIQDIVSSGQAKDLFSIGDQFMVKYNDGTNDYELPWDVVSFRDATLENGVVVPAMWLQSHYAMQAVQFDAREAFYYAETELAAGTYNVTVPTAWSKLTAGTYQFTLASPVPAGGQICFNQNIADVEPSTLTVSTYESNTSTTAIETVAVSSGSGGTSLGSLVNAGNADLWSLQAAGYGYNRWSQSAMRQFLNSDKAVDEWWKPQSNYDRPPTQLATVRGFKAGFEADFLSALSPVKVQTAANTVTDGGVTDITYDTFFCPSLEQEYIVPQASGIEGEYFEYWKERLGIDTPQKSGAANALAEHIRYAYDNQSSAQYVRLRSAYRGNANNTWGVNSTGNAYYGYSALNAYRPAPACVICKKEEAEE